MDRDVLIGYRHMAMAIAFLPSQGSVSTIFLKNCGEGLRTTTCLITVVGGKQGHVTCEMLLHQQSLFLCQLNLMEIIGLS